jgi:hypothetical protein|tara:strand:+ start:2184 stop:3434 length:1251 start_codon:yes stop_codon:yes gene_type:complete
MHLIDINDGSLSCTNGQGEVVYDQPSIAYFDGQNLLFGHAALANVKSQPQACASQYMGRLSDETLASPLGKALNHADLIFHHLKNMTALADIEECAFLIPAYFSNEQLQLLLGIAQAAGLKPSGFINSGLAHQRASKQGNDFHLFDIGLRQGQLSSVQLSETMLVNSSIANFDSLGLFSIVDTWLQEIANVFLDSIRFDPLHSATTEQQAFDQVLSWIDQGQIPQDARISVDIDGYSRSAEINTTQLTSQLAQQIDQLGLTDATHLVITPRAAKIPKLVELLESRVASLTVATSSNYFEQARTLAQTFEPGQIDRLNAHSISDSSGPINQPQMTNNSRSTAALAEQVDRKSATHLLGDLAATPVEDRSFEAFLDQDGLLRPNVQVLVNDQPASQARLKHGDQVLFAGNSWLAIHAE